MKIILIFILWVYKNFNFELETVCKRLMINALQRIYTFHLKTLVIRITTQVIRFYFYYYLLNIRYFIFDIRRNNTHVLTQVMICAECSPLSPLPLKYRTRPPVSQPIRCVARKQVDQLFDKQFNFISSLESA